VPDRPSKILVVEDSPTMCQLYRIVLGSAAGADLIFARNGVEGLDRAAQSPDVELVIVDVNMPQMDGLEFLRRLRGELQMKMPALVISTEGQESDRLAAREAGADAYLRKPWTPDQLISAIERLTPSTPAG
jgi:two-component system, chemotaxis family, chemotaxis protein CheY